MALDSVNKRSLILIPMSDIFVLSGVIKIAVNTQPVAGRHRLICHAEAILQLAAVILGGRIHLARYSPSVWGEGTLCEERKWRWSLWHVSSKRRTGMDFALRM